MSSHSIGLKSFKPPARVPTRRLQRLSAREFQVLKLLNEGLLIKEVADRMGVTPKTADNHCTSIRRKLDIHGPMALHDFARSFRCSIILSDPHYK